MKLRAIAGSFGTCNVRYADGVFVLPGGPVPIERTVSIEENARILESSWIAGMKGGAVAGMAAVPVGALTGLFATGTLLAAPFVVSAAAIGAGLGYIGGKAIDRSLVQIVFDDRRGLIAIGEKDVVSQLLRDFRVARAAIDRSSLVVDAAPAPKATSSLADRSKALLDGSVAGARAAASSAQSLASDAAARLADVRSSVTGRLRARKRGAE